MNSDAVTPLDILLPYQRKWVADPARFKIGLMSRQSGKSFSCAAEAVTEAMKTPKMEWVVLSAGERQALEFLRKAREWAEAYKVPMVNYAEDRTGAEALMRAAEINWPNGSRLLALPANPDTARGYSANLILDEFAFHERPEEIWRAIYPSISNPLRGQKKIRIVSTANGKNNKFYELWDRNQAYSRHKVTIHDAVEQGLQLDIEELKAGLGDPDGWAQEYECEFVDTAAVLLPYELIAKCEHAEASETALAESYGARKEAELYLGIDFGRKRDLTVCWVMERLGHVLWTREVLCLEQMATPEQVEILRLRIARARRVCLDYTGAGVGLGDYLVKEFGEYNPAAHRFGRIELCQFSAGLKTEIFSKLRMKFENLTLRIPVSRAVREDLHGIQRVTTANGTVTYRAPHTPDGHSDRCTALALSVRAAENNKDPFVYQGLGRRALSRLKGVLI